LLLNLTFDVVNSPNKILRSFPPLNAKEIIALTVLIVRKIPEPLYAELIDHAK
jgi:cell cycle arrest protein BUB2